MRPRGGWPAWAWLLGAVLGLAAPASAQEPIAASAQEPIAASAGPRQGPREIVVGLYVNQLPSIDIRANQLTIDFWIWFRWRGLPDENPAETFELVGGRVNARMNPIRRSLPDGHEYSAVRVNATLTKRWDLTRYPFDDHEVAITIEDALHEDAEWRYVPDLENTDVDPDVVVSGWTLGAFRVAVRRHTYHSNYGDTTIATGAASDYSRFTFRLQLRRVGGARFFKVFFGLFVATLAAWTACFIRPRDASPRVAVSIGALFAGAASSIAINNQLPDSSAIMLADAVVFLALGTILFCLFITVLALHFHYGGQEERHRRLDRIAAVTVPVVFVAALGWLVRSAG